VKQLARFVVVFALFACAAEDDSSNAQALSTPAPQRYIVKFHDHAAGLNAVRAAGGSIALELPEQAAAAAMLPSAAVTALQSNPHVDYVEIDPPRYRQSQTIPYGISMVQATDAAFAGGAATNKLVCIIDSGYGRGHEDLDSSANVTGTNLSGTGNWYEDTCGHGSHVAGTIAAVNNTLGVVGVAPGARIHVIKVFNGELCDWTYTSTLVSALNACRNAGANVVSMSLGGAGGSVTEQNAFNNAWAAGVLSIAAAGNDGTTSFSYPASYTSVVSVGAIDATGAVADFSQKNSQVDLAAPGVAVESTLPYFETNTLTAGGTTWNGGRIEGAARTNGASGVLVNGGLCDSVGSWSGKVVLCQRGSITFFAKVDNVLRGGGVAAAVYNNAPGGFSGTLGDGVTSTLPAISLSDTDGNAALAAAGQTGTVVSVRTPGSSYEAWNGTSMATPHVSGVATLIWSYVPTASNTQVRSALESTAQDLGTAGRDNSYGYGLVQAKGALDALVASQCGGPETQCTDGADNDCDGLVDAADSDCDVPICMPVGDSCTSNAQCCSGRCGGKKNARTCKP
jgi:serine protease